MTSNDKENFNRMINLPTYKMKWYAAYTKYLLPLSIGWSILQSFAIISNDIAYNYWGKLELYFSQPYNIWIIFISVIEIIAFIFLRNRLYLFSDVMSVLNFIVIERIVSFIISTLWIANLSTFSNAVMAFTPPFISALIYMVPNYIYFYKRRKLYNVPYYKLISEKGSDNKPSSEIFQNQIIDKKATTISDQNEIIINDNLPIKFCRKCGQKISAESMYCKHCGAAVNQEIINTEPNTISVTKVKVVKKTKRKGTPNNINEGDLL